MVNYISTGVTNYLIRQGVIEEAKKEIYKYGVITIIVNLIGTVELLVLGLLTNTFSELIIFMISIVLLRSFAGGYHCKNYIPCNISIGLIYLTTIWLHLYVLDNNALILNIICFVSLIEIYIISPVIHVKKKLTELKKRRNKIICIILATCLFVIAFNSPSYAIIKYVIIITAFLQIITKGGKSYVA